jgi:hypothetical protein
MDEFAVISEDNESNICLGCADPDPDDPDYIRGECPECGATRIRPDGGCDACSWGKVGTIL